MKVTSSVAAPNAIVTAYKNPSPSPHAGTEAPAYDVALSQEAQQRNAAQKIRSIQDSTTSTGNLKEAAPGEEDAIQKIMQAEQQRLAASLTENNDRLIIEDRPLESIPRTYQEGLLPAIVAIEHERDAAPYIGILFHPLYQDVQEHFDTYKNAYKTLSKGTSEDFRAFNLKLASIAKAGLDDTEEDRAAYHIAMGDYSADEVKHASAFAKSLQNSAGVYVAADFYNYNVEHATGFRFSYNGSLAKVGVKELSFMSEHKEAMTVWTNAAQGKYKNGQEISAALKDAGLQETASEYESMLASSSLSSDYEFTHSAGELWETLSGYNAPDKAGELYSELQEKMRGADSSPMTYRSSDLNHALQQGHSEKRFLEKLIGSRPPSILVREKGDHYRLLPPEGNAVAQDDDDSADTAEANPKTYADEAIKQLQEKIAEIRERNIPAQEKQKLINALKLQILTYQNMKLQDQKKDTSV